MHEVHTDYIVEQTQLGNVMVTDFGEDCDDRVALLDLAEWSGDEEIGELSISMGWKDEETTYLIKIKRFDVGP